jgi:GT2 family glycosyltransferase
MNCRADKPCPKVLISVLNWNNASDTIRCLASLYKLDYQPFEITVVDNASQDTSIARLRRAYPNLWIIRAEDNLGYAHGNQLAADAADAVGADLLWIVNNDVQTKPNTLTELVRAYQEHGEAAYGSVPLHADTAHEARRHVAFMPRSLTKLRHKLAYLTNRRVAFDDLFPSRRAREVKMLSGSSILIPLSVIEKHGFMDTQFFMYAEEIDYCLYLRERGVPVYIVPSSIVFHQVQGSSEEQTNLRAMLNYYQVRNRLISTRRRESTKLFLALILKEVLRIFVRTLGLFVRGTIALRAAAFALWGLWDGLRNRHGKKFKPEDYLS